MPIECPGKSKVPPAPLIFGWRSTGLEIPPYILDMYAVREGDTVIVTRLDRLARSTRDLLNVLAAVADKGASFRSLADVWADTTTPHGRLMLTVLGGLAESAS
jgi:hypothetical protein